MTALPELIKAWRSEDKARALKAPWEHLEQAVLKTRRPRGKVHRRLQVLDIIAECNLMCREVTEYDNERGEE